MAMYKRLAKELPMLRAKTLQKDGLAVEAPLDVLESAGLAAPATATGRGGRGRGGGRGGAASDPSDVAFTALLAGPLGSPFEGGVFRLRVLVSPKYPMEPPKMKFETRLFHPNVGRGHTPGAICIDILRKEAWSPALTLERTLVSIASLLADPNPLSPMDGEAANLYTRDRAAYDRTVREWVQKYARPAGSEEAGRVSCSGDGAGAWAGDFGTKEDDAPKSGNPGTKSDADTAHTAEGGKVEAVAPAPRLAADTLEPVPSAPTLAELPSTANDTMLTATAATSAPERAPQSSSLLRELSNVVIDLSDDDGDAAELATKRPRVGD